MIFRKSGKKIRNCRYHLIIVALDASLVLFNVLFSLLCVPSTLSSTRHYFSGFSLWIMIGVHEHHLTPGHYFHISSWISIFCYLGPGLIHNIISFQLLSFHLAKYFRRNYVELTTHIQEVKTLTEWRGKIFQRLLNVSKIQNQQYRTVFLLTKMRYFQQVFKDYSMLFISDVAVNEFFSSLIEWTLHEERIPGLSVFPSGYVYLYPLSGSKYRICKM